MPRETVTQDMLYYDGVINSRHDNQLAVIKCIGCHFLDHARHGDEPKVSAPDIRQCRSVSPASLSNLLHQLDAAGLVVSAKQQNRTVAGRCRIEFSPSDTPEGRAFLGSLSIPEDCPDVQLNEA